MFCRVGRIIDSLPVDWNTRKRRGFGFVKFKTKKEVLETIDMAKGRSWGGRRITVNMARPGILKRSISPLGKLPDVSNKAINAWIKPMKAVVLDLGVSRCEGWTIKEGS